MVSSVWISTVILMEFLLQPLKIKYAKIFEGTSIPEAVPREVSKEIPAWILEQIPARILEENATAISGKLLGKSRKNCKKKPRDIFGEIPAEIEKSYQQFTAGNIEEHQEEFITEKTTTLKDFF